ncbi:hypothetical protein N7G274_010480 [Stereocaulon virgatum]|uniref:Uncharacterized protein n=1 Tax=Stereocaulon virgatum TaxID=373712 RepID=A0ABR3ZVT5_9LECA
MTLNRIVEKMVLATLQNVSQRFTLEAATKTQAFKRTEERVNAAKSRIIDIVQNSDDTLPLNTARAVVREFEHGADNHISVVCIDNYGKYIMTKHIVPKK